MTMNYRPDAPAERELATGPVVGGVASGLLIGLAWELLSIQTDWRLGFSPPVWEIVVGWIGLSSISAFAILVITLSGLALYSTNTVARNPQSYDARQAVAAARVRAAAFAVGLGGLMVFGGVTLWVFSGNGPVFAGYRDFAKFTTVVGILAIAGAIFYLKKDPEPPL